MGRKGIIKAANMLKPRPMPSQAAASQMQAANTNASLASSAYNQQSGVAAQNANPASLRGAYNQYQSGLMQAAPNNFGFQQAAGMQNAQAGMAAQNAQFNMQAAMSPYSAQPIMGPQQTQLFGIPSGVTQAAQSAYPFPSQAAQAASQNPYAMQNAQAAFPTSMGQPISQAGPSQSPYGQPTPQSGPSQSRPPGAYGIF